MIWMANGMTFLAICAFLYLGCITTFDLSDPKLKKGIFELIFFVIVPCNLFFGISLYVWPVRVWRHQLPLRFNRKTRKVYLHFRGKTYIEDWDTIRAYLTVQSGLTGVGAPIRDQQVNIEFDQGTDRPLTIFLMGTHRWNVQLDRQADAFWEYIRRYMEEGPQGNRTFMS